MRGRDTVWSRVSTRRRGLIALLGLGLVIGVVGAVVLLGQVDPCMSGSGSGSCPSLADVNGVRYTVSVGHALRGIEPDLTPYAAISRTNVPGRFAEMQAYAVDGVDPAVLLIARSVIRDGDEGPYRMLTVLHGDRGSIWPSFCEDLPDERLFVQPECGAPAH